MSYQALLPPQNLKYGISVDSLGYSMGLRDGDMILSVNNTPVNSINRLNWDVIVNNGKNIEVEREGKRVEIPITDDAISELIRTKQFLVEPRIPFIIELVAPGNPAEKAGIKKGDRILAVNNVPALYFQDATRQFRKNKK